MSGRNVFERNPQFGTTPTVVTPEEALKYGDKLVALLPNLEDGEYYEIVKLTAGTGIVKHGRTTRS